MSVSAFVGVVSAVGACFGLSGVFSVFQAFGDVRVIKSGNRLWFRIVLVDSFVLTVFGTKMEFGPRESLNEVAAHQRPYIRRGGSLGFGC